MAEVTGGSEDHRNTESIAGSDHVRVAHRSARLKNCADAGGDRRFDTVGEREECIGGERRSANARAGLVHRESHGVNATHLTGADTEDFSSHGEHDRVRLHVLRNAIGEEQALELLAKKGEAVDKPLVVRLDGNNADEGRRILLAANNHSSS